MRTFGARREDFGKIAVSQRANALRNPHALMKTAADDRAILAARPIAIDPSVRLRDALRRRGGVPGDAGRHGGALKLRPQASRHDRAPQCLRQRSGSGSRRWAMDIDELYTMAGVKADDLDFVQTYDDIR